MADKTSYALQLMDHTTNKLLQTSGGAFIVCATGAVLKSTLLNPAADFDALANPVTPTRDMLRFALDSTAPVSALVDIYGITGDGRAVVARNVTPGESEIWVPGMRQEQTLLLPLHITDFPAATETEFGISLPTGALVLPFPTVKVIAEDATETLDVGLLSSESGDADGFIDLLSVATAGLVSPSCATTATLGALLRETVTDSGSATASVRAPYAVGATAKKLTATPTAGSDTLQALVSLPYYLPLS